MKTGREEKKEKKDRQGIVILAICAVFIVALGSYTLWLSSSQVSLDKDSMCPKHGPSGYMAILIDTTDPYNIIQKKYLKDYFTDVKTDIEKYTKLSMFPISDQLAINPKVSLCNPGDGSDASSINANPALLRRRWEDKFSREVDKILEDLLHSSVKKTSPIMEMIQAVSVSAFPVKRSGQRKKLIIVSDMLQNTADYSHYREMLDLPSLQRTPYYERIRPDLREVEVTILYLHREGAETLQSKKHKLFWANYIASMGGKLASIVRVTG